jgi:quercetin dioxygenase-like cupin family protein
MGYGITSIEDVPSIDLSDAIDMDMDPEVRRVQTELGTEEMVTNVWEFEKGDAMVHHYHDEQEELYYVIDGEFRLKIGDAGDTEEHTVEEGDVFAFSPDVGRGYVCVSEKGTVLTVGAPNVMDIDPEKYTPFDEA